MNPPLSKRSRRGRYWTLEWSHDLLSEEARVLFRRISVFVGAVACQRRGRSLPYVHNTLAAAALGRDDVAEAARHVAEGLGLIRRPASQTPDRGLRATASK